MKAVYEHIAGKRCWHGMASVHLQQIDHSGIQCVAAVPLEHQLLHILLFVLQDVHSCCVGVLCSPLKLKAANAKFT